MSRDLYQVVRHPIVTEKNMHRSETRDQYTFEVDPNANKVEIRQAIETLFGVKVKRINTMNVAGKRKRAGFNWHIAGQHKKAIVTLEDGHKIDIV